MSHSIRLDGVSKRYGEHDVLALSSVSLTLSKGEFVAVMGPSGCGKSTLLNLIAGIDRPTTGQIFIGEQEISGLTDKQMTAIRRDRIGFVFQFFNLLSTFTVQENITLPLELAGGVPSAEVRARAKTLLNAVGLADRSEFLPSQLSGGEMQRAAVARAIIHKPEVILADEPTGNLDTDNGLRILELLKSLSEENKHTIVMATHSEEAAAFAGRVVRMKDGQIVSDGRH